MLPMDDGVRVSLSLFLPETPGPWPAVFEARPYRKDDLTAGAIALYRRLVAEGDLAVCRADVRGTGSSEGLAPTEYTDRELADWVAVIAWLADQPWCNGNVGMYGTSYSGFNSLQVAALRPPALKAIIPIFATDRRYTDDVHFGGGVRRGIDFLDYPLMMLAMNALPPVPSVFGEGWREEWLRRIEDHEPWELDWLEHQNEDEFWTRASVFHDEGYEAIEAATLIVAGHADGYHNMAFRGFERLRAPKRLLFGPWSHMSPRQSMPGPRIDHVPEMIRWWQRWLRGDDNGIDREPRVVVFARRSTRPEPDLDTYEGLWRAEPSWPPARRRADRRPLAGASAAAGSTLVVRGDVGVAGSIWCAASLPFGTPWDQREDEAFSLVFDWPSLEEPLEIMGHPTLELTVTSSTPVAFVSAKLCDAFPGGESALVTRGILNLTHRDGHAHPSALEPGRPVTVTIELDATAWIWEPGHRVRLALAGADFPSSWPPPEAGTLTVDLEASTLELPVLDGPAVAAEPRFEPGDEHASTPERVEWSHEHDILRRTHVVRIDHGGVRGREGDVEILDAYRGEVGVERDTPGTAWAKGSVTFEMGFAESTVRTESRGELRSDRDTWFLTMELDVDEDGERIAERRWTRTVPRDLQ